MITASLLISIIVFATSATADGTIQQYRYAEQLFESGDYQAARREYKRLLFYQPDTEFRDVADYRIAQSYYYQKEPDRAERLFHEFLGSYPNSPFRFQSQLMIGQLQFDAGAYSLARTTLFELLHASEDTEVVAAAHYLRGWCYVHTSEWNKAITELRRADTLQIDTSAKKKGASISGYAPCRNTAATQITANGRMALHSCPWKRAALCRKR